MAARRAAPDVREILEKSIGEGLLEKDGRRRAEPIA